MMKSKKFTVDVQVDDFEMAARGWKVRDALAQVERTNMGDEYYYEIKILVNARYVGPIPVDDFGSESVNLPVLVARCDIGNGFSHQCLVSIESPRSESSDIDVALVSDAHLGAHLQKFKRSDLSVEITPVDGLSMTSPLGLDSLPLDVDVLSDTDCENFPGLVRLDYARIYQSPFSEMGDLRYIFVAEGEIYSFGANLPGFPTPILGVRDSDESLVIEKFYPTWSMPFTAGRGRRFLICEELLDIRNIEGFDRAFVIFEK